MPGDARDAMRRHVLNAAVLWVVLTIAGELAISSARIYPFAAAEEAKIVDSAFQFLMILSVPVFTFVLAALLYSLSRFRVRGEPTEDGPPMRGSPLVGGLWLLVTTALAIYVIFNPGLKGLAELRAVHRGSHGEELVVKVEGMRWVWRITYPQYGIASKELVLPVHRRVRFDVTALDVVHSFWVPAFRMKIDAVPGMTTRVYATPTVTGSFAAGESQLRLQCAELCGLGHDIMHTPVSVVDQAEFSAWVAKQR